ncbi:HamA C-terminal domain-containing protein [Natronococcus roseus]|uniref:HamA C-terminal domain-containing protein n=1 Tax=Natronococcus roseus TaxID=1052014 RepID=UPI00374D56C2
MSESILKHDWSSSTVIDEDELLDYVFPTHQDSDAKIEVRNYCIEIGGDTIDTEAFIQFLKKKFLYFVFPEDELEEHGIMAYNEALQRVGYDEDYDSDGLYGELLLFVFIDAVLDMPMITHKLLMKSNPNDEEKGSDGVFFGEYDGEVSLALGEAKFYTDKKGGIRSSLESTSRFHGAGGDERRRHSLSVASRGLFGGTNLDGELDQAEIAELAEQLTTPSRDYRLIHPIFIGYENTDLVDVQTESVDEDQLRDRIVEVVKEDDVLDYIDGRISEEHANLKKHYIVLIFLPVEDTSEFKKRVKNAIYPHNQD